MTTSSAPALAPEKGVLVGSTFAVSLDEDCVGVTEVNKMAPDSKGWRRLQCIQVVRADQVVEFTRDMGPREYFPEEVGSFSIVTGGIEENDRIWSEHKVGEALEMADQLRDKKARHLEIEPSPLDDLYHKRQDAKRDFFKRNDRTAQHVWDRAMDRLRTPAAGPGRPT